MNASERYEELQEIGRGGMGRVALVRDRRIGRAIAMKQMLHANASAEDTSRFVKEIHATAQLEHPNIVPVYDVGVAPDQSVYYTMRFIRGESLRAAIEQIKRGRPEARAGFTLTRLLQIFLQVCNGVGFANAKGVVHRDLKPDNIM